MCYGIVVATTGVAIKTDVVWAMVLKNILSIVLMSVFNRVSLILITS